MTTIAVLFFGTLGVALRYLSDLVIKIPVFPVSTLSVNVVGCFVAGWLFSSDIGLRSPLLIGFCGGLTTFSALILQCLQMMREGNYLKSLVYLVLSQALGLGAAWVGMRIRLP